MRVIFASLFGVDLDADLLPFWIRYYLNFNFDEYRIALNSSSGNTALLEKTREYLLLINDRINVTICRPPQGKSFDVWYREAALKELFHDIEPDDRKVVADSDEIQRYPVSPGLVYDFVSLYDVVSGEFADRWSDRLMGVSITRGENPFKQFPHEGNFYEMAGTKLAPCRTKIFSCAGDIETSVGSHSCTVKREHITYGGLKVYHFHFKGSFLERMAVRGYVSTSNLCRILDQFGERHHPDADKALALCIDKEAKLDKLKFGSLIPDNEAAAFHEAFCKTIEGVEL